MFVFLRIFIFISGAPEPLLNPSQIEVLHPFNVLSRVCVCHPVQMFHWGEIFHKVFFLLLFLLNFLK